MISWYQLGKEPQGHAMQVMSGKLFRAALIKQEKHMQQDRCIALLP